MSKFSSPFLSKSPFKDKSILQEDQKDQGVPWSKYTDEDVEANKGSGTPLPPQFAGGQRVYPNTNDAWQTEEQASETEELENTNN